MFKEAVEAFKRHLAYIWFSESALTIGFLACKRVLIVRENFWKTMKYSYSILTVSFIEFLEPIEAALCKVSS